ncbi:MAG TPA: RecQ family ATP-dependent DNA helicase [Planctomycetota bacterium]|nr:RecQ family ATP-dependent DNA helicase [Planctomycetota bacterium]
MDSILETVRARWGFDALRPLQRQAIEASLAGRDALVVLPTGGGKSLCYQVPALLRGGLTVVVSPLIALMRDQVVSLSGRGIPASLLNSSLGRDARRRVEASVVRGDARILYVSPERFGDAAFRRLLGASDVRAFAVDEAHCISHWGPDFRSAYGRLALLRRDYPGRPIHAFTATATPRVREDIVRRLALRRPVELVGDFFRPNLRLRVAPRIDALSQALAVVRRHPGEAGLVYRIRRADVDGFAALLRREGVDAVAYHAGMDEVERSRAQDAWMSGAARVVVATVAFGMGIDRRDARFVVHAAMPQSLEHYQQETGRAGRDGAPAECALFWSAEDADVWRALIRAQRSPRAEAKERMVEDALRFCESAECRHRALVEHFGQAWTGGPCGACDVCAGSAAEPGGGRFDRALYEVLKTVRLAIADEEGIPASAVASESALRRLAAARPAGAGDVGRGIRISWRTRLMRAIAEHDA